MTGLWIRTSKNLDSF